MGSLKPWIWTKIRPAGLVNRGGPRQATHKRPRPRNVATFVATRGRVFSQHKSRFKVNETDPPGPHKGMPPSATVLCVAEKGCERCAASGRRKPGQQVARPFFPNSSRSPQIAKGHPTWPTVTCSTTRVEAKHPHDPNNKRSHVPPSDCPERQPRVWHPPPTMATAPPPPPSKLQAPKRRGRLPPGRRTPPNGSTRGADKRCMREAPAGGQDGARKRGIGSAERPTTARMRCGPATGGGPCARVRGRRGRGASDLPVEAAPLLLVVGPTPARARDATLSHDSAGAKAA